MAVLPAITASGRIDGRCICFTPIAMSRGLLYETGDVAPSSPMTATAAVRHVTAERLLLPGIQRSFVWRGGQIEALFDSILRGYPIGTMLLWATRPREHPQLRFYRLAADAFYKGTVLAPAKPPSGSQVLAILDGQQRLTALNIGMRGSLATGEHAQQRRLYIDLDVNEMDAGSEKNQYAFQFRTGPDAVEGAWFLVSDAGGLKTDRASLDKALNAASLTANAQRRQVLQTLVTALTERPIVRFDIEKGNLDRVLNVFARINKGGTSLTYVDWD